MTYLKHLFQAAWLYKYTEMDTVTLRELIDKVVEKARAELMKEFDQLPLGLLDLYKSKFTTFDLDKGEIEFDLYLPIPMKNFEKMMKFSFENYVAKLKKMFDKYFPRRDFNVWDIIYRLKPVQWAMEKDWVPPIDGMLKPIPLLQRYFLFYQESLRNYLHIHEILNPIFIPYHYGFILVVRVSGRPSVVHLYFHFSMIS